MLKWLIPSARSTHHSVSDNFWSLNHTELSWVVSLRCKSRILNSLVEFVSSLTVTTHIRFHSMVVLFATTFDTILVVCLLAVWTQIHVHCTITVVSWQTRCALLLKQRFLLASFPLIGFRVLNPLIIFVQQVPFERRLASPSSGLACTLAIEKAQTSDIKYICSHLLLRALSKRSPL